MPPCQLCPRRCGADRTREAGLCGADNLTRIGGFMRHHWEEPAVSGHPENGRGTGAVFFSGCPLHCVFCQNRALSHGGKGTPVTPRELADLFLRLQEDGAYSLDLVSPTQDTLTILRALELAAPQLRIPVLWNTGGYERPETIRLLNGYVDVFLTDWKYDREGGARFCDPPAPDYAETAAAALAVMAEQVGPPVFDLFPDGAAADPDGPALFSRRLRRGLLVRHLILPGERHASVRALETLAGTVSPDRMILSLMRQYTPDFAPRDPVRFPHLGRRVTSFEYQFVQAAADRLGFSGYGQEAGSVSASFTPDFAR